MTRKLHSNHNSAFTLSEVFLVLACITVLAAALWPSFERFTKRKAAEHILEDLRTVNDAIFEHGMRKTEPSNGKPVTWAEILPYIPKDSTLRLYPGPDKIEKHIITLPVPGKPPKISANVVKNYSDVVPLEFWDPYNY